MGTEFIVRLVELLGVVALVSWQVIVFRRNRQLIARVAELYPPAEGLKVEASSFVMTPLGGLPTATHYDALTAPAPSPEFAVILTDTNDYLRNNKGAAADFNILKDISERHAEALDEEIQAQLSTPLYLGLLGTFGGAILGLSALVGNPLAERGEATAAFGAGEVNNFLGGVLIAMLGSLVGLALTLAGSQLLKQARATRDRRKNAYYTFLQKALLPKLNTDMQASMGSLKAVLDTFNQDFFGQIQRDFFTKISEFTPLIVRITENIAVQKNFLEQLEKIGYSELANATVKVFDRVDESAQSFEKFLGYQQALNATVQQGAEATRTMTDLLARLARIEQAAELLPQYFNKHDEALTGLLHQLVGHENLLRDVRARMEIALNEGAHTMQEMVRQRIEAMTAEKQLADTELHDYFRKLRDENIYQQFVDFLRPLSQQLPAEQAKLAQALKIQDQHIGNALLALQKRLDDDKQFREQLALQQARTTDLLERLAQRNWLQRLVNAK